MAIALQGGWRWAALLGFALLAPVGLPAGGFDPRAVQMRRRLSPGEPLLSSESGLLRCAPQCHAPSLVDVPSGMPMRQLRSWRDHQGRTWLQVESSDCRGRRRRGWVEASLAA